jgi:hypothetical protein
MYRLAAIRAATGRDALSRALLVVFRIAAKHWRD